jgi:hypothetical protein
MKLALATLSQYIKFYMVLLVMERNILYPKNQIHMTEWLESDNRV